MLGFKFIQKKFYFSTIITSSFIRRGHSIFSTNPIWTSNLFRLYFNFTFHFVQYFKKFTSLPVSPVGEGPWEIDLPWCPSTGFQMRCRFVLRLIGFRATVERGFKLWWFSLTTFGSFPGECCLRHSKRMLFFIMSLSRFPFITFLLIWIAGKGLIKKAVMQLIASLSR